MAGKSRPHRSRATAIQFEPQQDSIKVVGGDGRIEVLHDDGTNDPREASIFDLAGSGCCGKEPMTMGSGTTLFRARVLAGSPGAAGGGGNNKSVEVKMTGGPGAGQSEKNDFRANAPSGSGSYALASAGQSVRQHFSQQNRPVPATLSLKLDSDVQKGTLSKADGLNRATLLQHPKDPGQSGRWYSQQMDIGAKDRRAALWILEKRDKQTWVLTLQRDGSILVTYQLFVTDGRDCTFPLQLRRVGTGGRQFKKWALTVTVSLPV